LVLQEVAGRLRRVVRPGDLVGRYGGDEFVVVTAPVSPGGELEFERRLAEVLDAPVALPGGTYRSIGSFGVVRAAPGDGAADVLRRADSLMYEAKRRRARP